jgi:nitrite reductase/ring-hydroxylating ferredoxin subunit
MFLRNAWYTALWSHELKNKSVAKTLLNDKIVLFRNASGQVGALEDCCCHRAAPLSLGEISGEYLTCGYHGLKFDTNGECVEVPGQNRTVSGREVNWLINQFRGERLPTIDLAHSDLPGGKQRPEQHRSGVRGRQHGLRLDPSFELLVQPLDRIRNRYDVCGVPSPAASSTA